MPKTGVLFVCLGNICRSPIAHAYFEQALKDRNLQDKYFTDSAGTSAERGFSTDERSVDCLKRHGITFNHTSRQLKSADFNHYQYIFGMDESNIRNIERYRPKNSTTKVLMLGEYHPDGKKIIRDPFYDRNDRGFEEAYELASKSIDAFLDELEGKPSN